MEKKGRKNMNEAFEKMDCYIEAHRQEMIDLWEELVNIDSGTDNVEGVMEVCNILRKCMTAIDMQTKIIESGPTGPVLVGEWNREANTAPIILIGHMDTVFSEGDAKKNPFHIDEKGYAHGPGVLDMKAGLVIAVYVIKALQAAGYDKHPVKCVFAGDEEKIHVQSNAKEILAEEMKGAVAAFNFETGYLDDGLVVGRKGGGMAILSVHGVAVHSGIAPEKGRSAILEMSHKIVELEGKNDLKRGKLINCGEISGGTNSNTIPGECQVVIAFRFPSVEIRDEIVADMQEIAARTHVEGTKAQISIDAMMECMECTDEVLCLFEHVKKTAQDCGYGDIHAFTVGGVSDSGIAVTNGVPAVCAMGVKGEGNHTGEEFAVVESLLTRTFLAASSIYTL